VLHGLHLLVAPLPDALLAVAVDLTAPPHPLFLTPIILARASRLSGALAAPAPKLVAYDDACCSCSSRLRSPPYC
jgi:hypothetical protein